MTTSPQSDEYLALSRRYIRQAEEELQREDYLQVGGKAWGAVATAIKAVAEQRGWQHKHHDLTGEALLWLADESAKPELKDAFALVEQVHRNFYENRLTEQEVARGVDRARFLLQEVTALSTASLVAAGFKPESNRQKRRWEKLTGRQWDEPYCVIVRLPHACPNLRRKTSPVVFPRCPANVGLTPDSPHFSPERVKA